MKNNTLKSQKGFSLIELMIVVAIIGVLAAIAVPNFQKFQAKAKQSEAKSSLSAIYTSEKAFHAEWSAYDTDLDMVGYKPEGQLRYIVGFSAETNNTVPAVISNYTGVPHTDGRLNSAGLCALAGASCTNQAKTDAAGTARIVVATASVVSATAGNTATFVASAEGYLLTAIDIWSMSQNKTVTNPTSGL